MDSQLFASWHRYVRNLPEVLQALQEHTIIAVGVAPYQRIIPGLFMSRRSYQIYCVKDSADIDVLRNYAYIFCLEEKMPKVAAKVHSTGYLLRNYAFQAFLKSRKDPFALLFYHTNSPIVNFLNEQKIPWIGNDPQTFAPVLHKEEFRKTLKQMKLQHLPDWTLPLAEFSKKTFAELFKRWQKPLVCQPSDYDVSGGTFFVHSQEDLLYAQRAFTGDERFAKVNVIKLTPFIEGDALSMLGCVTEQGVLTSTLQLQLVDVPEALHGYPASGVFFGHDWGYRVWSATTETDAQVTVELIGEWLAKRGYRGIFGIDFIYDNKKDRIYPLECNPRFTGAIPVYSLINLATGVPPIDFFTLASYLNIPVDFHFQAVNEAWKRRMPASHIALTPRGVGSMRFPLACGIYRYDRKAKSLEYMRPGAFLHELKSRDEFILIDQVPREGQQVMENVPRLFKIIFPQTIAQSSQVIKPEYGEIVTLLSRKLRGET